MGIPTFASGTDTIVNFAVNGRQVYFPSSTFIRNGVTYVDLQALAGEIFLSYTAYDSHGSVVISNNSKSMCIVPGDEFATVSDLSGTSDHEYSYHVLTAPCLYNSGRLSVAARDIATIFGYPLEFKPENNTVYFGYSPEMNSSNTLASAKQKAYYFQNQDEFQLPSHGSGYCWTCSYAMLITNITGYKVTPSDIAAINSANGASGAHCYHSQIASKYNLKFVSALPTDSPYYGGRDSGSGGTFINNPGKDRAVAIAALKQTLDLHPEGVLVRYAQFPHTMVAVGYEGDTILFNDPAPTSSSTYASTGRYHCVPFEKTCIPSRGISLQDITFIQAMGF